MPKELARQAVSRSAEAGRVQDVEELATEAKAHLFAKAKDPLQASVGLCGVESAQDVATEVSLLPSGRRAKGLFVENLAARIA